MDAPATKRRVPELATVAAGTFLPCVVMLQCEPASVELSSTPKLDDGAEEEKPVAAATHRDSVAHATLDTVARLFASATRFQDLPPLVEA